ncbi:MAG: sulfurtransferase, partial [Gammaproteobacteria bacterium]|nr:sulfurtransferase [Gammaproteobacteria bacterium]
VDCRFDLARPEWGAQAFAAGHIPGAMYAHLDHDLSGTVTAASGRHPLPSPAALAATLGRFGVGATVQLIAYDQANGAYAARLWWLARWVGHRATAVLNGGLAAWQQAGLPLASEFLARAPRAFRGAADPSLVVTTAQVAAAVRADELARGVQLLVDARSAERFAGVNETIDPVAGHVPGARNHPFTADLTPEGRFLPEPELRRRWQQTLGGAPTRATTAMCGSGVTACHNLLALEVARLPGARLYAGSWSEWIRDPARPVALGADAAH